MAEDKKPAPKKKAASKSAVESAEARAAEITETSENDAVAIVEEAKAQAKSIIEDAEKTASDIVRKAKDSAKTVGDQMVKDAENRAIEAMAAINQNGGKLEVEAASGPRQFWMYNGGPETGEIFTEGDEIPDGWTEEPTTEDSGD